jgi:hypothetical protein
LPNPDFTGYDSLKYCIYDGYTLSVPNTVTLHVDQNNSGGVVPLADTAGLYVYPNPASRDIRIRSQVRIEQIQIFSSNGQLVENFRADQENLIFNVENLQPGVYMVVVRSNQTVLSTRFVRN